MIKSPFNYQNILTSPETKNYPSGYEPHAASSILKLAGGEWESNYSYKQNHPCVDIFFYFNLVNCFKIDN